jgi:hypothetical protein
MLASGIRYLARFVAEYSAVDTHSPPRIVPDLLGCVRTTRRNDRGHVFPVEIGSLVEA